MSQRISDALAAAVRQRADHKCEYCQSSEWLSGQRCHVDHVNPRVLGGTTTLDNLCLACAGCNGIKLDRVDAVDPETGERVALFNPRLQSWHENFRWSSDGTEIEGLTPCGRATVALLKLNRPLAISARALWVRARRHPPDA